MANFYKIRVAVFVRSNNPICIRHIYTYGFVSQLEKHIIYIYFKAGVKTNAHRPGIREG